MQFAAISRSASSLTVISSAVRQRAPTAAQQELPGNGDLVVLGVAVEADQLDAVEECLGNRLDYIGRRQKQHVGKVEVDLKVVVAEGVGPRGIEDLQQGSSWTAAIVGTDPVDFVEQDDRIDRSGFGNRPDDPAWQSATEVRR